MNEPFRLRWSSWARAAEQLGNHVLEKCPRWLIFVQGAGHGSSAEDGMERGFNMIGAATRPIRLSNNSKLVYSPHVRDALAPPNASIATQADVTW